ncbi:probable E3 ubiquitin-protein ligase HERC3 isoform X1 [Embiotoca jacksoni]|uniref:probable E3 ubiquitin-protein ligase HERC3 isoform X1 n=1 Tax=Embiotoca jacksoni TaxID=100190 RepID=UPI003703FD5B
MYSWGEDCRRGFWVKDPNSAGAAEDGVGHLKVNYAVADLCAGRCALAFVKGNGNAFIMRTNEGKDGGRVRGKQKFVKCKEKIAAVSCGDTDVVTLLSEGGLVLCVDTTLFPFTPRPLEVLSKVPVAQVACGSQHSIALTTGGQVYTWGRDSRGQLGLGRRDAAVSSPQPVHHLSTIPLVQIAAGGERSFALSVSGGVFGWGGNDCGQLGLGDTTDRNTPTSVHCLNTKKTIRISCGKDHTAVLTKQGAVFTFGSGRHGQLGHNSLRNELRPRLVAELWGSKVTEIACGRHHTLVMTDVKRVYSFGCREQRQLGRGEESHPSVPLPVQLPQDAGDRKIRNIFAGDDCSFATCSSDEEVHKGSIAEHRLDGVIDKWTSECDSKSWKKIKQEINRMFSSASGLNKSFLEQSGDKHFQTSPTYSGLNLTFARRAFKKLVKKDKVWSEIEAVLLHLLPLLDKKPVGVEGLRIYLLLNELLHATQKHKRQQSTRLAEAIAAAVTSLSADSLQVVGDWWSSLSLSTMVRYVEVWKKTFSLILSFDPVPRHSGVRNLLQVLQYLYNANSRVAESQRMPDSDFCLSIDDKFLDEDLNLWRLRSKPWFRCAQPLILCDFPFVMDLQSKKMVFDLNVEYTKQAQMNRILLEYLAELFFLPDYPDDRFELDLRRASLLEDTFEQLAASNPDDYNSTLVIYFDENYEIDNVHTKDFFYEVFHKMVSAESGMFMFNDSETLAWFTSTAAEQDQRFFLFGVLCGLALYNMCIIHLPVPLVLFKKLLGVKPSLEDMIEFSPSVGKSLQCILDDYKDDDIENLYMDFVIVWDGTEVDLDPKNPEKPLTSQNKKEYVKAYVNHAFNASVEAKFQEFRRGFFQVCDKDLVKLFKPKELQDVLVGKDFHNWEKLKQNTGYEGVYHAGHPNIMMFWEVFDELTENQKKAFLWFVTGFEQVPILGMDKIKMIIKGKPVGDQYYPEALTCFSTLELPVYSTKEIMQAKLTEALSNNRRIPQ